MLVFGIPTAEARDEKRAQNWIPKHLSAKSLNPQESLNTFSQTAGALTGRLLFVNKPGLASRKKVQVTECIYEKP